MINTLRLAARTCLLVAVTLPWPAAQAVTIYDIQFTGDPTGGSSPYADQTVTVTGVVTGTDFGSQRSSFYMCDTGGGAWSGVFVFGPEFTPMLGDCVRVTGRVVEFNGMTEISNAVEVTVLGAGVVPEPVEIPLGILPDSAEAFEGVLIRVGPCRVNNRDEWESGFPAFRVNDLFNHHAWVVRETSYEYEPEVGDEFTHIVGCIDYYIGHGWEISPRRDEDIGYIDERPPQLESATAVSAIEVNAYFSEGLSSEGASDPGHYTIRDISDPEFPELDVQAVTLFSNARTVHIVLFDAMQGDHDYHLDVYALQDLAGNELVSDSTEFQGYVEWNTVPIGDIYDDFAAFSGEIVVLRGIVNYSVEMITSSGSRRIACYLQDNSGRGLFLSQSGRATDFPYLRKGNAIVIWGIVSSFAGTIQLNQFSAVDIILLNENVSLPDPISTQTGDTAAQNEIIATSIPSLRGSGTWCTVTGVVNRVDEHFDGGTDLYINDGSGDLVAKVWDETGIDSVLLDDGYYRLGNELVGMACRIIGPADHNNGEFRMLVGDARGIAGLHAGRAKSPQPPETFRLENVYPNPFNPATTIRYSLSRSVYLEIGVFNLMGQRVAAIASGVKPAGIHKADWRCDDCASGLYVIRLRAGDRFDSMKILMIK